SVATRRSSDRRARSRRWWTSYAQRIEAGLAQQAAQRDERQPDQTVEVATLHAFEQRNAQSFGLEAPRTVVGPLAGEIVLDFFGAQRTELHAIEIVCRLVLAGACVEQYQSRMKIHPTSTARRELRARRFV